MFCLLHFVLKLRQKITMQNTLYVFFLFPFFFLSLSSLSPFPNFILSTETKLQKLLPTSIFVYLCFQITFFFFFSVSWCFSYVHFIFYCTIRTFNSLICCCRCCYCCCRVEQFVSKTGTEITLRFNPPPLSSFNSFPKKTDMLF